MTTIACDGTGMAGDGQTACSGTIVGTSSVKVRRLDTGALFGSCGTVGDAEFFATWLETGAQGDPPKLAGDFGCIVLEPNGRILQCGDSGRLMEVEGPMAMGSGMDYAMGALHAGADLRRAIEIAAKCDPHTGGKITVLKLAA